MKVNHNFIVKVLILLFSTLFSTHGFAQEATPTTKSDWNYLIEPYLLFPNMRGTVGLADLPEVSVDASTNAIFGHLKMGAMFMLKPLMTNGLLAPILFI